MQAKNLYRLASLFVLISLVISTNLVAYASTSTVQAQATTSFTFTPVADAYVTQSNPDSNYGSGASILVDNTPLTRSYLRFEVSGLNGNSIQSAKLRIYANSSNSIGYAVSAVSDNTWVENTITYNNSPSVESNIANSQPFVGGAWIEVDISSYIQAEGAFSLALSTTSDTNTNLASRESGANAPQLVITTVLQATSTSTLLPQSTPTQTVVQQSTATQTSVPQSTPANTNTPIATAIGSQGQSLTFTPVADAYVNSRKSNSNYGSLKSLDTDASPVVNSYLRFTVQGLSGQVTQARLTIYANSGSAKGLVAHAVANNSWGETTLNYNNAPTLDSTIASSPTVSGGAWVTLDVTSYLTGNGTFSFGVTTPGSTAINLSSRESGGNSPKLIVSTNGSTIAQPTATPITILSAPTATSIPPTATSVLPTATPIKTATPIVIPPSPTATSIIIQPSPTATATTVKTSTPTVIPPSPTAIATINPTATPANTIITGKAWYVDNLVSVSGDGSSWDKSWKSFSAINWGVINPGDTIYISGGSSSQTYNETLTIGASGSNGKFITIDVGANSSSPFGHDGMVIIDGGGTRNYGILASSRNYIRINGYDHNNQYKLQIINVNGPTSGQAAIYAWNCNFFYVDYVKINNSLSRGIHFNQTYNSRIRGSDIETGITSTNNYTSSIYIGSGSDNTVENNKLIVGSQSTYQHVDPLIAPGETRLTIRSNWLEWMDVAVDPYEIAMLLQDAGEWYRIYNNVLIGSHLDQEKMIAVKPAALGGLYYFWNNTFIAKNPTGGGVEFYGWDRDYLGEFKNNVIYSPGGFAYLVGDITAFSPASKIDNNCVYGSTTSVTYWNTNGTRSWAQWQAAGYDVHSVNANPLFISNFTNLHLQNNSPCKDAGADLSAYFNTDKDGTVRPQGTGFDIGAYEYSGGQ